MKISVVIPAHNASATIADQLKALASQCSDRDVEVLVVDNNSTDDTAEVVEKFEHHFPSLQVISESDRQGANAARNRGISAAVGEVILLCDADDIVSPNWIDGLTSALSTSDVVGGPALAVMTLNGQIVNLDEESVKKLPNVHGYLPYVLSCNMGFRMEVARAIGGFDESFAGGHEEVDFCWRAQQHGFSLNWVQDATISYFQRSNLKKLMKQRILYGSTSIQLWERHNSIGQLNPISFKASVRNLGSLILRLHRIVPANSRRRYLLDAGWVIGVFSGHLKYRKLGGLETQRIRKFGSSDPFTTD